MDFLEDIFGNEAAEWIGKLLLALLVLIITWIVRKVMLGILPRIVKRLTKRTQTDIDDRVVSVIESPLHLLINVLGLWVVFMVLGLPAEVDSFIDRLMASLIAVALFWALYRAVDLAMDIFFRVGKHTLRDDAMQRMFNERMANVLVQVTKAIVVVLGFAAVLERWGYNVGALVAGLGLGGLAVALAAQDALANLIGYFVIVADEPFIHGDYVIINGSVSGLIEKIGFRSTRIRGLDQSLIMVPNKTVANANVTNWSRLSKRWYNIRLGLEYRSSPEQILTVVQKIRDMLQDYELADPDSVLVQFIEFNDSSLDVMIRSYIAEAGYNQFQAIKQDINLRIMTILAEHNVGVAFPSQSLYVEQVPAEIFAPPEGMEQPTGD
jgi:MscS family membrane protein